MVSLTVAQATVDPFTIEDPEDAAKWQARLAAEAINTIFVILEDFQSPNLITV